MGTGSFVGILFFMVSDISSIISASQFVKLEVLKNMFIAHNKNPADH